MKRKIKEYTLTEDQMSVLGLCKEHPLKRGRGGWRPYGHRLGKYIAIPSSELKGLYEQRLLEGCTSPKLMKRIHARRERQIELDRVLASLVRSKDIKVDPDRQSPADVFETCEALRISDEGIKVLQRKQKGA